MLLKYFDLGKEGFKCIWRHLYITDQSGERSKVMGLGAAGVKKKKTGGESDVKALAGKELLCS